MKNDLLERAITAASQDPNRVASEFEWEWNNDQWCATDRASCKKTFGARPDRVVVTPGKPGIYVHGSEPLSWLAYLNGGVKPTGESFKRCLAELAYRTGISPDRPHEFQPRAVKAPPSSIQPPVPSLPIEPFPEGDVQPHEHLWPFEGARRVHRYDWGYIVYPAQGGPCPCRTTPIGLIIGIREGTHGLRKDGPWIRLRSQADFEKKWQELRGIPGVSSEELTTYRHRQVREAIKRDDLVLFVEGEKDVEAAESVGLVADTNPFGAGKLTAEQAKIYKGGRIAVVPDNDDAGILGAERSALCLLAAGAQEVRVLEPLREKAGYDFSDYLEDQRRKDQPDKTIAAEIIERAHSARRLDPEVSPPPGDNKIHVGNQVAIEVVLDAFDRIELAQTDPEAIYGIRTGLSKLDHLTLGLNPGFLILAAPPGLGKTTFAIDIALHACECDAVLYLSWENSKNSLILRMLCNLASLDTMAVRRGTFNYLSLLTAYRQLTDRLHHLSIVETDPSLTLNQLEEMIRRQADAAAKSGRRLLVVLDYLQLFARASAELQDADPRSKVERLSGALVAIARSASVPILAISSQSRESYKDGRKSSSYATLKESGSLEYDADVVLTLTRPENDDAPEGERVLHMVKQREGPSDVKIPVMMDLQSGRVLEIDRRYE